MAGSRRSLASGKRRHRGLRVDGGIGGERGVKSLVLSALSIDVANLSGDDVFYRGYLGINLSV